MEVKVTVVHTLAPEIISLLEGKFSGKAPAPKPEQKVAAVKAPLSEVPAPGSNGQELTIEKIRALVNEKSQSGKKEGVKNLLSEYGVTKITALAPESYSDFYEKLNQL